MKKKQTRNEKRLAKKEAKAKTEKKRKRLPRQEGLPGISDDKIIAIENCALDYAEIRDARQELTKQEVDVKKKLIDLMHKKELTEYKRNGITVKLVVEEESVKVRVKESEDDLPTDIEPAPTVEVSAEVLAS